MPTTITTSTTAYTLAELRDGKHLGDLDTGDGIVSARHANADETAREKITEWGYDDSEMINDDINHYWKGELAKAGYNMTDTSWEAGYSQGDHFHFAADVDIRLWLRVRKLSNKLRLIWARGDEYGDIQAAVEIRRGGGSSVWRGIVVDYTGDEPTVDLNNYISGQGFAPLDTPLNRQLDAFRDALEQDVIEWESKILSSIRDEIESRWTEEYALDMAEANEYLFDNTGRLI